MSIGADGVPHITLYDPDTQLSFVYDTQSGDDDIAVSHGGYGEPVVDVFSAFEFDDEWGDAPSLAGHLERFAKICEAYVNRMNDPRAIESALVKGYREGLGDVGMTYDGSPSSRRSQAYDYGRTARRKMEGLE